MYCINTCVSGVQVWLFESAEELFHEKLSKGCCCSVAFWVINFWSRQLAGIWV
jgi:hypothetical protein